MAGTFTVGLAFSASGSSTAQVGGAFVFGFAFQARPSEPLPACRFLTVGDLEDAAGGRAKVDRLFDFDGDGRADPVPLARTMRAAEDHALTYLLANWSEEAVCVMGRTDFTFRRHVAFVALELGAESKHEFTAADGKGRYWTQYERANGVFDRLKRNALKTTAASKGAGEGAQAGGAINPPVASDVPRFTFVPDKRFPTRGGY